MARRMLSRCQSTLSFVSSDLEHERGHPVRSRRLRSKELAEDQPNAQLKAKRRYPGYVGRCEGMWK